MTTPSLPERRIIIASFSTTTGAKQGLDLLRNSGVRLGNVALIRRQNDGSVEFTETQDWGLGKSAAIGALAAILLPGVGVIAGAIAGAVAAHFIDSGFPDALIRQLGAGIPGGTSMMIALANEDDLDLAERELTRAGATILGVGLEPDLSQAMKQM
ncbi:MAG: DUF1269 domain-containing protein [Gemmatimonadota bacterium]